MNMFQHQCLNLFFRLCQWAPNTMRLAGKKLCKISLTSSRALQERLSDNANYLFENIDDTAKNAYGQQTLQSFYNFVIDMAASKNHTRAQISQRISTTYGLEDYPHPDKRTKGVVLVTAHYGSFEVGLSAVAQAEPNATVLFQTDPTAFGKLRQKLHKTIGVQECHVDKGLVAWDELRQKLENNEAVIIQGDRCMPGQKGRAYPFMYGTLMAPIGPAKLATMCNCPLVPVIARKNDQQTIDIFLGKPIYHAPSLSRKESIDVMTQHVLNFFEDHIHHSPHEWHTLHKAFTTA